MQSELLHNDMPMIDAIWCVYEINILLTCQIKRKNWKAPSRIASNATESFPIPMNLIELTFCFNFQTCGQDIIEHISVQ